MWVADMEMGVWAQMYLWLYLYLYLRFAAAMPWQVNFSFVSNGNKLLTEPAKRGEDKSSLCVCVCLPSAVADV